MRRPLSSGWMGATLRPFGKPTGSVHPPSFIIMRMQRAFSPMLISPPAHHAAVVVLHIAGHPGVKPDGRAVFAECARLPLLMKFHLLHLPFLGVLL